MVFRVFVKKEYDYDITRIKNHLRCARNWEFCKSVTVYERFDVEGLTDEDFEAVCSKTVFQDQYEKILYELPSAVEGGYSFAVELKPGVFDNVAAATASSIQIVTGKEPPAVRTAKVFYFKFSIYVDEDGFEIMTRDIIRTLFGIDSREADWGIPSRLEEFYKTPEGVEILRDFNGMNDKTLELFRKKRGFAMSFEDLKFCQKYFRDVKKRSPLITELKVVDTYWSDHCRHTTFNTAIDEVQFADGKFKTEFERTFAEYLTDKG